MAIETNYRRLADMEDNIKTSSNQIDRLTKELARLRAGLDDYRTKIEDAQTQLEDVQTQHETATAEFNALIQKTNNADSIHVAQTIQLPDRSRASTVVPAGSSTTSTAAEDTTTDENSGILQPTTVSSRRRVALPATTHSPTEEAPTEADKVKKFFSHIVQDRSGVFYAVSCHVCHANTPQRVPVGVGKNPYFTLQGLKSHYTVKHGYRGINDDETYAMSNKLKIPRTAVECITNGVQPTEPVIKPYSGDEDYRGRRDGAHTSKKRKSY
ncbi:hypothetical protein LTR37_015229 [Vermiconidia calcicola]|uniref:Uncharacterized protein n=1 Tax=Vermiconidia calcicola TaxID=1690605 RepID=A0ACC3MRD1_9PEZI|nr:hypothetical protein LTR37_015229 [Vermiconidia calcicola]